jgi:hypothetical protein
MKHLEKGLKYMYAKSDIGAAAEEFGKQRGRPAENKVSFTFQDGTIKDAGVNGVQISDLLYFLYGTFASLNGDYPCHENLVTLDALSHAIEAQVDRKTDRLMRGVEGHEDA